MSLLSEGISGAESLLTGPYRFALVGDPVAHSRSPAIHNTALELAGLQGSYITMRTDVKGLEAVLRDLRAGELHGVNVTMPLKTTALARSDIATPEALSSGSANTLRCRDGMVEAHSTDVETFSKLYSTLDIALPLLVLGGGGSASAAVASWPGERVIVSVRDRTRSERLRDVELVPWGVAVPGAVLVNATPLGMNGETLPEGVVETSAVLIDLPYGMGETPAVGTAHRLGIPFHDGLDFLAAQAGLSFRWWTGVAVDSDALVRAAKNV